MKRDLYGQYAPVALIVGSALVVAVVFPWIVGLCVLYGLCRAINWLLGM